VPGIISSEEIVTPASRDLLQLGQVNPRSANEELMTNLPVELRAESSGGGEQMLAQVSLIIKWKLR
jgi:hypothetical protein